MHLHHASTTSLAATKERSSMIIADKSVLVTGANRGLGQALVAEPSSRGAARLYAGTRQPLAREDPRVTAVALDVTNTAQIEAAVAEVESLDILINNAGIGLYDGVRVHAVLAGPIDTDMSRAFDSPKASRESVANAVFAALL
jgi:NAD(P)-dependent dehydrogenase (short-subunit alcohol dehydrogenase family)